MNLNDEYQLRIEDDDEEICKRCDRDVNECECWENDAIQEMMREDW